MKDRILFLFVLNFLVCTGSAQVSGRLLDQDNEPIPFVNIKIVENNIGTISTENGRFNVDPASNTSIKLQFSSLGFQEVVIPVDYDGNPVELSDVVMKEDLLGLNEVVVTGTMKETFVKASPIKVEVIRADRMLKNLPVTNLMQGMKMINGVQEVVACGVCMTNSISINGLPGNYSAVLMDGTPIYGSLASTYGLNGIPIQMIERIEVIKGPSSTLYGSEAIAGVLNIITKNPEFEPLMSIDLQGSSHGEVFGNISASNSIGKWKALSGINVAYMDNFIDENEDGYGDIAGMDRLSLFSKWSLQRKNFKKFTIASKLYYEDRRNGIAEYFKNRSYRTLRGSDKVYGESIYTLRSELFGTYELPTKAHLKVDYSFSWQDQNSYYGSDLYTAKQGIAFANFIWQITKKRHSLTTGLTNRAQFYDDNTVATDPLFGNDQELQYIPGVFIEDELNINSRMLLLVGMRVDHYNRHGFIPAPRIGLKYELNEWTRMRLSAGTGFKVVNLFTEDHAFITGQRVVEIREELDPERSWNLSSNFNHTHTWFGASGNLDVDLYYTRFLNKIAPNYDIPGKIIYSNSADWAQSYGIAATFSQQFSIPLTYNIGLNVNRAEIHSMDENGQTELESLQFAPLWSGLVSVNYRFGRFKLDVSYAVNATGPMRLPEVYDLDPAGLPALRPRPTISRPFAIHNIQFTKQFRKIKRIECYGGIQNLFNFTQNYSPLTGLRDPNAAPGFSLFFDTSYAYAPLHGRELFFGIRLRIEEKMKN